MSIYPIQYLEDVDELFEKGITSGSFGAYFDHIEIDLQSMNQFEINEKIQAHFGSGRPKIDTINVRYVLGDAIKPIFEGLIVNSR